MPAPETRSGRSGVYGTAGGSGRGGQSVLAVGILAIESSAAEDLA
jgi:hypothetical protein